jgi:predicted nucleotidyltransferase
MISGVILNNIEKIKMVCKKYQVKSLYLFGSAATGKLSASSDIDFIVDYYKDEEGLPLVPFDYFDLLFSLEDITGLKVDLVVVDAIRNKFFKERVDSEKVLLYAA